MPEIGLGPSVKRKDLSHDPLWAAGEVTGGIHAGNRLGGNAEADVFTFGKIAGHSATAAE